MALNAYRIVANALTGSRALAGIALLARPSLAIVLLAILTDWIDGTLARRGGDTTYGARFDLEADSLLTLGAAVAAVRRGTAGVALVAPVTRYAAVAVRDPRTFAADEIVWDRVTGILQMAVLVGSLAPGPFRALRHLAGPVSAARCAALAAFAIPRAVQSTPTLRPAEARLVLSKEDR